MARREAHYQLRWAHHQRDMLDLTTTEMSAEAETGPCPGLDEPSIFHYPPEEAAK